MTTSDLGFIILINLKTAVANAEGIVIWKFIKRY